MRKLGEGAGSANGPRSVQAIDHMLGVQDVFLGDGICLIVGATGVDKITREERPAPGPRDGPSRALDGVDSGVVPEMENMAGDRFGVC